MAETVRTASIMKETIVRMTDGAGAITTIRIIIRLNVMAALAIGPIKRTYEITNAPPCLLRCACYIHNLT